MSTTRTIAIAGAGGIGLRTAQLLDNRGHNVVLVERDHSRCKTINDEYVGTVIEGDASRPRILRQADPDRCDVLAALTGDSATNLGICMAAKALTDVRVVMRADDPEAVKDYGSLVDAVVHPHDHGARAVVNEVAGAGVRSVEAVGSNLEILQVTVSEDAPAAGRSLEDVHLPRGSLIISDAAGGRVSTAETVLDPGNEYLVAIESAVMEEVMNLLRG